jgi:RNA polymerase sigma-70 factor, ECF subfamily
MADREWLLERFEAHGGHLRAVARRMLRPAAPMPSDTDVTDPAAMEALLGELVTLAFLSALEAMTPEERLVFALHEVFGLSTEEAGTVIGRSPASARRLARSASGRIRGAAPGRHTSARRRV